MARERKSLLPAAPQEPEIAQTTEPATEETVYGNPEEVEQAENIETAAAAEAEAEQETAENPSQGTVSENGEKAAEGEDELEEEPLEKLLEPFSKDQLTLMIKEAVAKRDPDVMEAVHKLANAHPAHCKIFVHGLGWDANSETITSVFGKYGEIADCKVVQDNNTGKSKGYGFILYKHRDGARRALKQPHELINVEFQKKSLNISPNADKKRLLREKVELRRDQVGRRDRA
ncbi:UBP1-associated protein 2A-like [Andrographis paniculata]|uniref:UBP1-associated protein 2A-like n=1 Tax=Andrographis paniculata TaxID=175694 RepID=UPI0021E7322F|nr:UBP1-associated protein 2A-like [Andrographis paniculata]